VRLVFATLAAGVWAVLFAQQVQPPKGNWSRFAVGSYVKQEVRTTGIVAGVQRNDIAKSTQTLTRAPDGKLILATVTNEMNGKPTADRSEIPIGDDAPTAKLFDPEKTSASGTEVLQIAGKPVSCRWAEERANAKGVDSVTRTWFSEEVPGFLVKMEQWLDGSGAKIYVLVRVTDFRIAKPK